LQSNLHIFRITHCSRHGINIKSPADLTAGLNEMLQNIF